MKGSKCGSVLLCLVSLSVAFLCNPTEGTVEGEQARQELALTPPRGWNSYDSFSWIISEEDFLANAQFVADNLLQFGYEYVVVDFLWYRKHEPGAAVWTSGFENIDEWGRLLPDPGRWPSSRDGKGFELIAQKVHAMGLKFGIHVMRGISTAAVENNTPILGAKGSPEGKEGQEWKAADVTLAGGECPWMWSCFSSVNTTSEGGRAFITSLYEQYAAWGVDFIKHDCIFGEDDISLDEIAAVSQAITNTGRPMVYSLSPGVRASPPMARKVAHLAHMYRVTSDDWDSWGDVLMHFDVARDFAASGLIGAPGLQGGRSWPDLDMLPLGWLTDPGASYGPYRGTRLSRDEQRTQVTLWAIAKSPMMFGGDLRHIDQWTLDLIANPGVLQVNANTTYNKEILRIPAMKDMSLPNFELVDCQLEKAAQWKIVGKDQQACWFHYSNKRYSRGQQQEELKGCLHWTPISTTASKSLKSYHILTSSAEKQCLDAKDMTSLDTSRKTSFSLCNNKSNQAWQITSGGHLLNEISGLCTAVILPQHDIRIWTALGYLGQVYFAIFNLGEGNPISITIDEIMGILKKDTEESFFKFLQSILPTKKPRPQCLGWDVWSGKVLGNETDNMSITIASHGSALVQVHCSTPVVSWLSMFLLLCVVIFATIAVHISCGRKEGHEDGTRQPLLEKAALQA